MSIASYYRGRISYVEVLDLEMPHFMSLRHMMYIANQTEEGQTIKEAEIIEDHLMEGMT